MSSNLFDGVYWHQKWEIEPGVFTPGANDVVEIMDAVAVPSDLTGKRVLDIGAWNGCCSFECERRGAAEVLAIGPESPESTGFDRLKAHLNSRVQYRLGSVYQLDPEEYGEFDVVLFFGVFYHLRYPLLALDQIRRIALSHLFFESSCIDEDFVIDGERSTLTKLNPALERACLMQFFQLDEFNADPSNWFSPNEASVRAMLKSSGFTPVKVDRRGVRIRAAAVVDAGWPQFLQIGCGENVYYDLFMKDISGPKSGFFRSGD